MTTSFIDSGFTSRVEYDKWLATQPSGGGSAGGTYTVYYWGKTAGFFGRAFAPLCILNEAGASYTVEDPSEKPAGCFAVPACKTPSGAAVSQVPAICHTLGHELGLAPSDAAADAKCLQMCCDAVDLVSEADKEGKVEGERKAKWLSHFDGLVSVSAPLTYADFAVLQALALATVFRSSSLGLADFPPNLKAWWIKMEATKGVSALLALGTDLMMGGRPFPKM